MLDRLKMKVDHQRSMATDPEGKGQEYGFVNLVDSQGLGETAHSIVRSQVTRDYHRRSNDLVNPVHVRNTSLEETIALPKNRMNRFILGPEGLCETTKRPKPKKDRHAQAEALGLTSQDLDTEVEGIPTSNVFQQAETKLPKRTVPVKKKQSTVRHFDNNQLSKVTLSAENGRPHRDAPDALYAMIGSTMDPFDAMPWSMSTWTWAFIFEFCMILFRLSILSIHAFHPERNVVNFSEGLMYDWIRVLFRSLTVRMDSHRS